MNPNALRVAKLLIQTLLQRSSIHSCLRHKILIYALHNKFTAFKRDLWIFSCKLNSSEKKHRKLRSTIKVHSVIQSFHHSKHLILIKESLLSSLTVFTSPTPSRYHLESSGSIRKAKVSFLANYIFFLNEKSARS